MMINKVSEDKDDDHDDISSLESVILAGRLCVYFVVRFDFVLLSFSGHTI